METFHLWEKKKTNSLFSAYVASTFFKGMSLKAVYVTFDQQQK